MHTLAHAPALPVATPEAIAAAHNAITEARFRAMFAWHGKRPLCDIDADLLAHAQFPLITGSLDDGQGGAACQ